jgi:hypothetical protein
MNRVLARCCAHPGRASDAVILADSYSDATEDARGTPSLKLLALASRSAYIIM